MSRSISEQPSKRDRERARWVDNRFVCECGSRHFTVFRERVARKVHTRDSHRRRRVGVCSNGHKTRIAF